MIWENEEYTKNSKKNQDLEKYLKNPVRKEKKGFKELKFKFEDIEQTLFNMAKKEEKIKKELPNGISRETAFILKNQLDAYHNGLSDMKPEEILSIENIKKLQNRTTESAVFDLIEKNIIKANLKNIKNTNQDNILSLSRLGLIQLNETNRNLVPKNEKKSVSKEYAATFKEKLLKDEEYLLASRKEKEEDIKNVSKSGTDVKEEMKKVSEKIFLNAKNYTYKPAYVSKKRETVNVSKNSTEKSKSDNVNEKKVASKVSGNKATTKSATGNVNKEQKTKENVQNSTAIVPNNPNNMASTPLKEEQLQSSPNVLNTSDMSYNSEVKTETTYQNVGNGNAMPDIVQVDKNITNEQEKVKGNTVLPSSPVDSEKLKEIELKRNWKNAQLVKINNSLEKNEKELQNMKKNAQLPSSKTKYTREIESLTKKSAELNAKKKEYEKELVNLKNEEAALLSSAHSLPSEQVKKIFDSESIKKNEKREGMIAHHIDNKKKEIERLKNEINKVDKRSNQFSKVKDTEDRNRYNSQIKTITEEIKKLEKENAELTIERTKEIQNLLGKG